ncbi:hypothetical protein [Parvibaculum sp.]|uniref:hypothetical protein n=1 Tax=Parvibaculum sp. TaxID=2024848 RepID=UPI003BAC4D50
MSGIWRGVISFITTSVLAGLCIVIGIDPSQVIADFLSSPWISDPLVRLAALILGGILGIFAWKSAGSVLANVSLPRFWRKSEPPLKQDDLVSLKTAAVTLYEQTRTGFQAKLAERLDRADADNGDEPGESLLRNYVNSIIYDESIPLFGSRPPSEQIVELPLSIKKKGDAVEGGASFQFLSDKKPTYLNLHIRRSDLNAKANEFKALDASIASPKKPDLITFCEFLDIAIASGWPADKSDRRWIEFFRLLREEARNEWIQVWGRRERFKWPASSYFGTEGAHTSRSLERISGRPQQCVEHSG